MPELPPVPDVARVEYQFSYGQDLDVITRTFWNYTGGTFSSGNAASMAEDICTTLGSSIATYFIGLVTFTGVRVTDMASDTAGDGTGSAGVVGTRSGGQLPADAAVLANYTIDRRYRGGHPKGFWPMGSDSDLNTPQQWSAGAVADFTEGVQEFFAATQGVSAGGSELSSRAVVSYYQGNTVVISPTTGRARNVPKLRTGGPMVYDVLETVVSSRIASQRRRLGRG